MLAKTTYFTGITDALATVDAYATKTASIPGGSGNNPSAFVAGTAMAGFTGNIKDAAATIAAGSKAILAGYSAAKGLIVNAEALKKNILSIIPNAQAALAAMPAALAKNLLAASGLSQIQATIAGVTKMINKADLSSLTGISSLIAGVSGAAFPIVLKDLSGLAAIGTNVLKQAAALGIPKAYTQFASGMLGNLKMLNQITRNIIPSVIAASNVGMLSEIAHGPVGKMLNNTIPNVVSSFMKVFKLPANSKPAQLLGLGNQLMKSFNQINSMWNKTVPSNSRSTNRIAAPTRFNANPILGASADFKKLVKIMSSSRTTPYAVRASTISVGGLPPTIPSNTTSESTANSDGSTQTTYHLPSGVTHINKVAVDGTSVWTTEYPPGSAWASDLQVGDSVTNAYSASLPIQSAAYVASPTVTNLVGSDPNRVNGVEGDPFFDMANVGAGSYGSTGTTEDGGRVTEVVHADGSRWRTVHNANGGSLTTPIMEESDLTYPVQTDPYENISARYTQDEWQRASAVLSAQDEARMERGRIYASDVPAGYSVKTIVYPDEWRPAKETLSTSFPSVDFSDEW